MHLDDPLKIGGPINWAFDTMAIPKGAGGIVVRRDRGMSFESAAIWCADGRCFLSASNRDGDDAVAPMPQQDYARLIADLATDRFKRLGAIVDGEILDGEMYFVVRTETNPPAAVVVVVVALPGRISHAAGSTPRARVENLCPRRRRRGMGDSPMSFPYETTGGSPVPRVNRGTGFQPVQATPEWQNSSMSLIPGSSSAPPRLCGCI